MGSRAVDVAIKSLGSANSQPLSAYPRLGEVPEHVRAAVERALAEPEMPTGSGIAELRDALAWEVGAPSAACITVTSGAMHGLAVLWTTLAGGNGNVVVPTPSYFVDGGIRLAGLTPRAVRAVTAAGWDWDHVEATIDASTRACFLSNPNNPTGSCFDANDLDELSSLARLHPDVCFVLDESYERLVYRPRRHLAASAHDNVIIVRSFSKSFALPHLRIGWITSTREIADRLRRVIEWQQLFGSSVCQRAALAALQGDRGWLAPAFEEFEMNRPLATSLMRRIPGLLTPEPQGGPFVYVTCEGHANERPDFAELWRSGVPAVPGPFFGGAADEFRLPFGGDQAALRSAVKRIDEWRQSFGVVPS